MDIMKNGIIRMTKDEAIKSFKKLLDVPNEMIVKYDSVLTEDNYRELIKLRCAEEMAISALEEVQQLHEIGTIEEFRELKEKAIAKKPKFQKITFPNHEWRKNSRGEVDTFAISVGFCNGPVCERCHYSFCEHCNPEGWEDTDCTIQNYICVSCGEVAPYKNSYCKCGQKLDWSREE